MIPKIRNALVFIFINACFAYGQTNKTYPPGDYSIDSLEVEKLCKPEYVLEYYQVASKNANSSPQILNEWKSVFKKPADFKQSGFLTIRFVVNCRLELCCFHTYQMDEKYQPIEFDEGVKTQLIAFIKTVNGWKSGKYKDEPINYFYYLNFVIKNGEFKRVSP